MIDCDVHNDWVNANVLIPYMDNTFKDFLVRGERVGGPSSFPHGHRPWLHPEGYRRADLEPAEGLSAGADYELMKRELLDKFDIDVALLSQPVVNFFLDIVDLRDSLSEDSNFHQIPLLICGFP